MSSRARGLFFAAMAWSVRTATGAFGYAELLMNSEAPQGDTPFKLVHEQAVGLALLDEADAIEDGGGADQIDCLLGDPAPVVLVQIRNVRALGQAQGLPGQAGVVRECQIGIGAENKAMTDWKMASGEHRIIAHDDRVRPKILGSCRNSGRSQAIAMSDAPSLNTVLSCSPWFRTHITSAA